MMCQECGQQEATTHLTQVADGAVCKLHLCPDCAEKRGLGWDPAPSVPSLMKQMGAPGKDSPMTTGLSCPGCHMTSADFKRTGRLGCERCYETFEGDLSDILFEMHHDTTHAGKVPQCEKERVRLSSEIGALEERLGAAVSQEAYEIAARLRDEITECRAVLASQEGRGGA